MHVVWFKRDLRIEDHEPLSLASRKGAVLPIYIIEPQLWLQPDMGQRHYAFLLECLADLDKQLQSLGQGLIVRVGEVCEILDALHCQHKITGLWSHQETGNNWTYQRDRKVMAWVKRKQIPWHESPCNGVIRRLKNRNGWAARWAKSMGTTPCRKPNTLAQVPIASDPLPKAEQLGIAQDGCTKRQYGGRKRGLELLESFLDGRGEGYQQKMSSPVTAPSACSRLSAHLSFGTLSIREVWHKVQLRSALLRELATTKQKTSARDLRAFMSRLRWHCHFIQKLEDEPKIEFENFHKDYNTVRHNAFNEEYFVAWKEGRTGYPLVDACMRALISTGWINFRMRAMLVSFASYHLWLHWRRPAVYMATLFTDYEPGIHYSQFQMQSGTTGINTIRIYNPIKQSIDQDPSGVFIRQWLPELAAVSQENIHTPWAEPENMGSYPMPIVEEKVARNHAREILFAMRKEAGHREVARKIVTKHASRRSAKRKTNHRQSAQKPPSLQRELPL